MTLYDLTKKYGEGKGEDMMWATLAVVSDAIENSMDDSSKARLLRNLYGEMSDGHYNSEYAQEDVAKMYYTDREGKKNLAPYWTPEQVNAVYEKYKDAIPAEYNVWDFYVVLNMVRADNCPLLKNWFPAATPEDMDKKFVELAVSWLNDPDSPYGTSKPWKYLNR